MFREPYSDSETSGGREFDADQVSNQGEASAEMQVEISDGIPSLSLMDEPLISENSEN